MNFVVRLMVCLALAGVVSCARTKPAVGDVTPAPIVTPDTTLRGRVVSVNTRSRYVILNFPVGRQPAAAQPLGVYRDGLKVGEVRIDDRWRRDDNVVADILAGEAKVGDEVKDR